MKYEIRSLTGLRGLAAVLVMFYHYNSSRLLSGPLQTFVSHGYLMVDVFFILSGYVMAMTYGKYFAEKHSLSAYCTFLGRRFARIYPLYALMMFPAAFLIAIGWMDDWGGPSIPINALVNLTMIQSLVGIPTLNTPGWSISAEWTAYLLFPLLVALCLRGSKWRAAAVGIAAFVALPIMTAAPALIDEPKRAGILDIWHYQTMYPVLRCLLEFSIGMVAFRLGTISFVKNFLAKNFTGGIIVIAIIVAMFYKPADIVLVYLLPAFMISIAQEENFVAKALSIRPILWLGNISFSIYMIHDLMIYFIVALSKWLGEKGIPANIATSIFTLLFGALVLLLSQLAYTYIEKPARYWLRGKAELWARPFGGNARTTLEEK